MQLSQEELVKSDPFLRRGVLVAHLINVQQNRILGTILPVLELSKVHKDVRDCFVQRWHQGRTTSLTDLRSFLWRERHWADSLLVVLPALVALCTDHFTFFVPDDGSVYVVVLGKSLSSITSVSKSEFVAAELVAEALCRRMVDGLADIGKAVAKQVGPLLQCKGWTIMELLKQQTSAVQVEQICDPAIFPWQHVAGA